MDIEPEREPPSARWIALAVTCLAGILAAIQSSSLIVALVELVTALDATFASIIWVLLSFMLAIGAVSPILGFFSDSGLKGVRCKLFNFGFAIFGLASLLCGFAQPEYKALDLIIYRALMGVGAGFIFSNSAPILADKFHPYGQMGLGQGLWGIGFALGSVVGPVVGGVLLEAGWSWIFWVNVPFCVVGCVVGFWQVKDYVPKQLDGPDGKKEPPVTVMQVMKRFDYLGAFLLLVAIIFLFIAVVCSIFPTPELGPTASIVFGVICGVFSAIFLVWDYHIRNRSPFVNFNMFASRTFTLCAIGGSAVALARGGLTFAFIFLYQGPYGKDALQAGINVIPMGIGMLLGGLPSGWIGDKFGYKLPSILGPLVSALGILGAAFLKPSDDYWVTAAYLFFAGLGAGIYNSPSSALAMLAVKPGERGQSSGVRMMLSMVANAFSIVICFDLIVGRLDQALIYKLFIIGGGGLSDETLKPFMDGFHGVIWVVVVMNVFAALCSIPLQDFKKPKTGASTATTRTSNAPQPVALKELSQKEASHETSAQKSEPAQATTNQPAQPVHQDKQEPGPEPAPQPTQPAPQPAQPEPASQPAHQEQKPAEEQPGQPEPLAAPLEGLDANPKEDAAIIAAIRKAEKEEVSELQAITVASSAHENQDRN